MHELLKIITSNFSIFETFYEPANMLHVKIRPTEFLKLNLKEICLYWINNSDVNIQYLEPYFISQKKCMVTWNVEFLSIVMNGKMHLLDEFNVDWSLIWKNALPKLISTGVHELNFKLINRIYLMPVWLHELIPHMSDLCFKCQSQ